MKLDFDLGNTRIKWHLQAEAHSEYGAAAWRDLAASSKTLNDLRASFSALNPDGADAVEVLVSSVAGPEAEALFNRWLEGKLSLKPHYISVEKAFAGLRVAYGDVSCLGVDRWLAMLATQSAQKGFRIVIDAGSAITIDYLNASGEHAGGLIVPGLPLLSRSMSRGAHNLRPELLSLTPHWQPGCDTSSGISQGASAMYAGLAKEALRYYIKEAAAQGGSPFVFLCGGDALAFLPWCERILSAENVLLNDTLVLDGVEFWRQHKAKQNEKAK